MTDSVPMTDDLIADEAALSLRDTRAGLKALSALELIEWDDDAWVVTKWKERQYESDDVTQRTRKHRSIQQQRNVPSVVDGTSPENREQRTEETDTDLVPTEPAKPATELVVREGSVTAKYTQELQSVVATGSSYDLLHEFRSIWPRAWQEAQDNGLNPKSIGIKLLGSFFATVTSQEPDYGRIGQLVGKFGKLSLLGIDEGIIANADDPYRYAMRVCQNQSAQRRAEVGA